MCLLVDDIIAVQSEESVSSEVSCWRSVFVLPVIRINKLIHIY